MKPLENRADRCCGADPHADPAVSGLQPADFRPEDEDNRDCRKRGHRPRARDCVSLRHNRVSAWDVGDEKYRQFLKDWVETCEREAADRPQSAGATCLVQGAVLPRTGGRRRSSCCAHLRQRATPRRCYEIYEWHRSWEQDDLDKVQIVNAKEAGDALRKAAESGHPQAMQRYAIDLDQGRIIKRDVDEAAHWMEQTLAQPPKDASPSRLVIFVGRLLTESANPEKRARGIRILESINRPDAKAYLGDRHPQGRPGARTRAVRGDAAAHGPASRCRRSPTC